MCNPSTLSDSLLIPVISSHVISHFHTLQNEQEREQEEKHSMRKEPFNGHKTKWFTKLKKRALTPTHVPAAVGQPESTEMITQSSATLTKLKKSTLEETFMLMLQYNYSLVYSVSMLEKGLKSTT